MITPFDQSVIEMDIRKDRSVNAIKKVRSLTGLGLREAKAAVDYYKNNGRWEPLFVRAHFVSTTEPEDDPLKTDKKLPKELNLEKIRHIICDSSRSNSAKYSWDCKGTRCSECALETPEDGGQIKDLLINLVDLLEDT